MFEVYRRKFIEQPFPRQFLGAFETIMQVKDKLKLSPEEIIEALTTVSEAGYEIEETMQFLGNGLTQDEIAAALDLQGDAVRQNFHRAIKKLKKNGELKRFLTTINMLRHRQYPEISYNVKITITD
jgi:hypothetical protein